MSQLLVPYVLSLMFRSIGIAVLAGVCCWRVKNVAVRHAVWVIVLVAMLVMPVVDYLLPAAWVPAPIQKIAAERPITLKVVSLKAPVVTPQNVASPVPVHSRPVNWWKVAVTLYALVAFAMFARLALGYWRLWNLRRGSNEISSLFRGEIAGFYHMRWRIPVLLESESVKVPMTIGLIRPAVILPSDWEAWDDWKLRAVLLHEFAHVRRCDWGIAVIAAMARSAYWLNPYSWLIERRLSELAEQASDDASMDVTQDTTRYAEVLLQFAVAAQNGGRLMKGGVAMAQQKMKSRIERVLSNPKRGTGVLKIGGWVLVAIVALPVVYSAAALRVAPEPAPAWLPTYAPEFGRRPAPQVTNTLQSRAQSTRAAIPPSQQRESIPAATVEMRKLAQEYELIRLKLIDSRLQTESQNRADEATEAQDRAAGTVEFLKTQLERLESRMAALKLQTPSPQQSQVSPPATPPSRDALLDLPDNEADLLAYLNSLAQLRGKRDDSVFDVSFTGIQERTIFMKVAEKNFSFGCESCSVFVGEFAVSSGTSIPAGPGILVRLSSDGNSMSVTCRATKCTVSVEDGNAVLGQVMVSGASESFRASELRRIVISKN